MQRPQLEHIIRAAAGITGADLFVRELLVTLSTVPAVSYPVAARAWKSEAVGLLQVGVPPNGVRLPSAVRHTEAGVNLRLKSQHFGDELETGRHSGCRRWFCLIRVLDCRVKRFLVGVTGLGVVGNAFTFYNFAKAIVRTVLLCNRGGALALEI